MILDSGNRREFDTGAKRDIQEGKGRCDLLPLDVVEIVYIHKAKHKRYVIGSISSFVATGDHFLLDDNPFGDYNWATMFMEVSKHFEEGHKKYPPTEDGIPNWKLGIPTHSYIDSAVRHYLKWARGDEDEPHDRAFVWNIICCIWTCIHKPQLNDYAREGESNADIWYRP